MAPRVSRRLQRFAQSVYILASRKTGGGRERGSLPREHKGEASMHDARRGGWRAPLLATIGAVALLVSGLCAATAGAKSPKTVWLCKPGKMSNPCKEDRTATIVSTSGGETIEKQKAAGSRPIDCFYVYPTVSGQTTGNSNLNIEGEETQIAVDQASRFSQVCKVYAPMYPQVTIDAELEEVGSGGFNPEQVETAYAGVLSAWHEYLAKFNKGHGVVLIGHSQGAGMLRKLIKQELDPNPAQRKLLVSALLMGGNVSVPEGQREGGDFQNIPSCRTAFETHCVVAYSTFLQTPPEDTLFGVVDGPVATLGGGPASGENLQVLCVNPTLLEQNGGSGALVPYESTKTIPGFLESFVQVPSAPTPWVSDPGHYTAQCVHSGDTTWLQVTNVGPEGDPQEVRAETLGPTFGLHLEDINLPLGNLVNMVRLQSAAYMFENN
jgi:hypothetical protein